LFESGAILLYLAEKTGQFAGQTQRERLCVLQWLMFQMGGVGPMLGQAHHFRIYAPSPIDYAIERYTNEAKRLYRVIDKQLSQHEYIAGDFYSIADMAIWPWLFYSKNQGIDWAEYPNAKPWFDAIGQRPAVKAAMAVLADRRKLHTDEQSREILFGKRQQAQS
jgi:GST-like protein